MPKKNPAFSKPVELLIKATGRIRSLWGWRGRISFFSKRINHITRGKQRACGVHGKAYNLTLFKGHHKKNLVIKKYWEEGWQNYLAEKDYETFSSLKHLGLSIPPTVALVRIKGVNYVALTDLSQFGDLQLKYGGWGNKNHEKNILRLSKIIGKEQTSKIMKQIEHETEEASRHYLDIYDAWEIIVDTKKKTARAFILDAIPESPRAY